MMLNYLNIMNVSVPLTQYIGESIMNTQVAQALIVSVPLTQYIGESAKWDNEVHATIMSQYR